MAVPQDQLITLANGMIDLIQNWRDDLKVANDLISQYANLDAGAGFAGLPTCSINADGSLGAEDPAPVAANLINTNIVATLNVAISSYALGVIYALLQEYVNLLGGQAVATQEYAPAMLAKTSQ